MEFNPFVLGEKIAKYRKYNNWSQDELANRANVSQSYIGKIESGEYQAPTVSQLSKLAQAFNITLDDLLEDFLATSRKLNSSTKYGARIVNEVRSYDIDELEHAAEFIKNYIKARKRK